MTIGQAKAKPYWFALCLTDVFYYLCIGFSKIIYVLLSFSLGSTV